MDEKLPDMTMDGDEIIIRTGRRLALCKTDAISNWYVSYSPRNDNCNAEGTWEEWVALAKKIIEIDQSKEVD